MRTSAKLLAEFLGSAGILMVVVGSDIMGETLAQGNSAIALLANSIATGAGLYALIQTFGPVSGAHFNPALSLVEYLWKRLSLKELLSYSCVQILGALVGVFVSHYIFGLEILQVSQKNRGETRLFVSEAIATFGLLMVITLSGKKNVHATPVAVSLYITSAYWLTSSTSFANPAVTIARSFTDTFAGILWTGSPAFIAAPVVGALAAFATANLLNRKT